MDEMQTQAVAGRIGMSGKGQVEETVPLPGMAMLQRQAMVGLNAAAVAHELNNLLTPMVAFAQLALSKPDRSDLQTKALQMVVNQGQQAGRVMHALMGFASPGSEESECDLSAAIEIALGCLGRHPEKDGVVVETHVPSVRLKIQPVAMEQILFNLLQNAVRSMGRGGRLFVEGSCENGTVSVRLRDTGRGIEPDLQTRLFEPFKRGGDSNGYGLGLYLSRELALAAGGELRLVESRETGTEFELRLPAA